MQEESSALPTWPDFAGLLAQTMKQAVQVWLRLVSSARTRRGGGWCRGDPSGHPQGCHCLPEVSVSFCQQTSPLHHLRSCKEHSLRPSQKPIHLWFQNPPGPRNSSRVKRVHGSLSEDPSLFHDTHRVEEGGPVRKMPEKPNILGGFWVGNRSRGWSRQQGKTATASWR